MSIIITKTIGEYSYYEDLFRAQKRTGLYLYEEHDAYVARLLREYADCEDLYSVSTTLLYAQGQYREAGDRSLLLSGLRATLKPQYEMIGTLAYGMYGGQPYMGLAESFGSIANVLAEVFRTGGQ